jgi:Flp pilus assembly protein TadD
VAFSRHASELEPASAKYAYTWAFYLARRGDRQQAIAVLRRALDRRVASPESYALLGRLLAETGRKAEAEALLRRAAVDAHLPAAAGARK